MDFLGQLTSVGLTFERLYLADFEMGRCRPFEMTPRSISLRLTEPKIEINENNLAQVRICFGERPKNSQFHFHVKLRSHLNF
jgi:hypothetical protein